MRRLLAQPADVVLHLLLRLLDDLLDPGGMDPAVLDQLLERELGDLAADAVEPRDDDHAGRVVDDHVDAGGLLEGADVPALAADDPPLHLVVGDVDRADGHLGGVRRGVALDRGGRGSRGPSAGSVSRSSRLVLEDQAADLVPQVLLDALQQQVAGLLGRERGDPVQHLELVGQRLLDLAVPPPQLLLLLGEVALHGLEFVFLPVDDDRVSGRAGRRASPAASPARGGRGAASSASASISSRRRSTSSLAARSAWRPMVSASRRASATIWSASPRGPGPVSRDEERGDDAAHGTGEQSEECRHASLSTSGRGLPACVQGTQGRDATGHTRTPGLRSPHPHCWAGGRRAHRQRLKRAFPGLAARGEAVRSGGSVSISDQHRREIGPGVHGTAPGARELRGDRAKDIGTRVLYPAAIGSPPSSRAVHPSGRRPARAAADAGARCAPHTDSRQAELHPQGHHRPEDGQHPDRSEPARRHARDPFRRSKSSGMLSAPGLRHRSERPASPRGARPMRLESPGIVHDQSGASTGTPRRRPARRPRRRSQGGPRTVAGRRCSSNLSDATGRSIARRRRNRRPALVRAGTAPSRPVNRRLLCAVPPCYHGADPGGPGPPVRRPVRSHAEVTHSCFPSFLKAAFAGMLGGLMLLLQSLDRGCSGRASG